MSDNHTHSFKDAFGKFLKEEHLDVAYKQKLLIESWERIMGRTIAARTSKMYFRGKTLFVELSSAALKEELNRSQEAVLARLEEQMGERVAEEVRFL